MQAKLIDDKIRILYERYRDRDFVANAQKEVEDIRRKALAVGAATTTAAFVGNEIVRLTMRSRIIHYFITFIAFFKLKIQNLLFFLIAPTVASKYYYDNAIHERIDNLWRIHCNRVEKGNNLTFKCFNVFRIGWYLFIHKHL